MNDRMHHILEQINALEEELRTTLHEQETLLLYRIKGKGVEFDESIRQAHRQLKMGLLRWLITARPQMFVTVPIIYGLIVPLVFLDICVTLYQATCFPIYRIAKVRRSDYIVYDHQHLAYLNLFEKLHCLYCSYGNGLLAYAREIAARTEMYFCPIKHAHRILGAHAHYTHFLDYGEAEDFYAKLEKLRSSIEREETIAGANSTAQKPHDN